MAEWESSLAVRDGVFLQVFLLTGLAYLAYRLLASRPIWRTLCTSAGLVLYLVLFAVSVVALWE